ncbi:MAG: hypothetical protein WCJ56_00455 [bacterium]
MKKRGNRESLLNELQNPEHYRAILAPLLEKLERSCPDCTNEFINSFSWNVVLDDDGQEVGSEATVLKMESGGERNETPTGEKKCLQLLLRNKKLAPNGSGQFVCPTCGYTGDMLEGTVFQAVGIDPYPVCLFNSRLIAQRHVGVSISECLSDLMEGRDTVLTYSEAMDWILCAQESMASATSKPLNGDVLGFYLSPSDYINDWGIDDSVDLLMLAEHRRSQGDSKSSYNIGSVRIIILPSGDPAALLDAIKGILKKGANLGLRINKPDSDFARQVSNIFSSHSTNMDNDRWIYRSFLCGLAKGLIRYGMRSVSNELREKGYSHFRTLLRRSKIGLMPTPKNLSAHPQELIKAFSDTLEYIRGLKGIGERSNEQKVTSPKIAAETMYSELRDQVSMVSMEQFDDLKKFMQKAKELFAEFMKKAKTGALRRLFVEFAVEEFAFYRENFTRVTSESKLAKLLTFYGTENGNICARSLLSGRRHTPFNRTVIDMSELPDILANELIMAEEYVTSQRDGENAQEGGGRERRKALFLTYRAAAFGSPIPDAKLLIIGDGEIDNRQSDDADYVTIR